VVTDLRMPGVDGLELLGLIKERWPETPVILVTVEEDIATVVEAIQKGAVNYLTKPATAAALCSAVARALATSHHAEAAAAGILPEILGDSRDMARVRHFVAVAARSDVNVLITGETGTGKEIVSRAIHRLSKLSKGPFVAHNCAVSPHDLFESQFFGHRRGAFTGAERDHHGLLERADGGVLFLDEMECLSPTHQGKLLRFLDDGRFQPVGCEQERAVSVRILSATNQHPERMLEEGALREDFYYRLCVFEIRLSPLRNRRQDIHPLAQHFLTSTGFHLGPEALESLQNYDWPGNIRQLRNVLARACAVARGGVIKPADLTLKPRHEGGAPSEAVPERGPARKTVLQPLFGSDDGTGGENLRDLERRALRAALDANQGHRGQAARALGIHRSTLRRKLRDLGIEDPPS